MAANSLKTPLSQSQVELRPIPDPTVLTTQQLQREIAMARDLVEGRLEGFKGLLETRLDGMDRAIVLLHEQQGHLPDVIVSAIKQLQSLHDEKFRSIEKQFVERDTRTEQTSRDSKVAVDAALQAAKEAVGEQNKSNATAITKSETGFTKQFDQLGAMLVNMQKSLDDKIDDLKSRLQAVESTRKGAGDLWAILIGVMGLVIAIGAIFYRR